MSEEPTMDPTRVTEALANALPLLEKIRESVTVLARALAGLEEGDDWPTNLELGGNLTGTRDDEYRAQMEDAARGCLHKLIDLGWTPGMDG